VATHGSTSVPRNSVPVVLPEQFPPYGLPLGLIGWIAVQCSGAPAYAGAAESASVAASAKRILLLI
jgi:hypothetical protein